MTHLLRKVRLLEPRTRHRLCSRLLAPRPHTLSVRRLVHLDNGSCGVGSILRREGTLRGRRRDGRRRLQPASHALDATRDVPVQRPEGLSEHGFGSCAAV